MKNKFSQNVNDDEYKKRSNDENLIRAQKHRITESSLSWLIGWGSIVRVYERNTREQFKVST